MNEKTKRMTGNATSGARSNNYIGIQRIFSPLWFHKTSSSLDNGTYNPILKPLRSYHENETLKLKKLFYKYGKSQSLTDDEIQCEWFALIKTATKKATKYFNDTYGGDNWDAIPFNDKAENIVLSAADQSLSFLKRKVVSYKKPTFWKQNDFWFGNDELFYLRKSLNKRDDGLIKVKIGKTTKKAKAARMSTYSTNGGGDSKEVYCLPCDGIISESNARNYLHSISCKPLENTIDWFVVHPDVFNILKDPAVLRCKIKSIEL
jgi:hypothetical protein